MPRAARLLLPSLAVSAVQLSGCGSQEATRDGVRDRVEAALLSRDVEGADAATRAACVADGMFGSSEWTKEERNAATQAVDGADVDPDLIAKLGDLLDSCDALEILRGGDSSTEPASAGDDDDSTTTTEPSSSDDDDTTTTSDG